MGSQEIEEGKEGGGRGGGGGEKEEEKSTKDNESDHPVWKDQKYNGITLKGKCRKSLQLEEKCGQRIDYWIKLF